VKIGIYSYTGFIQNHEDLPAGRLASPIGSLQDPEVDIASEMAGIVGAGTNNGVGMTGIDRNATLQSYSVLTQSSTCINDSRCSDEEETVAFERPDGTQETYYLNLYRFSDQIEKGRNNGVDVPLVPLGLPSGDPADYSMDDPGDPTPFINWKDIRPPEDPNPPTYTTLAKALYTAGQRFVSSLCTGWFGSCRIPPDPSTLFRDEIGFAVAKDGGVVVSPAGNLNEDGDLPPRHLPGMFDPYAVTVGGLQYESGVGSEPISWNRTRPAAYVDVAAFAKNMVGVSGAGPKQYDTNVTSTAASASIGAGVSSLLKAEMPALTGEDVEEILKRTARDAGAPGEDDATGTGAIDAGAALAYVRNNDVQRSTQSVDYVISDEVIGTETELRGNGFWQYSSTNCRRPKGDLHKFRAHLSYSQTFREAPDVWTRWGGSDGVLSSGKEGGAYYDPLQKRIEVVDADGRGFTVKDYYWEADFYDRIGNECQMNVPIPKSPEDFEIAYTAVGTEGPPPPRASLSGPYELDTHEQATWTASVNGGVGSTSYDWEFKSTDSNTWQDLGCVGSDCTHIFTNSTNRTQWGGIRVTVTKGTQSDMASRSVAVSSTCGSSMLQYICLSSKANGQVLRDLKAQSPSTGTATLTWKTAGSLPPSRFIVQHRSDSTAAWKKAGTVRTTDSVGAATEDGPAYRFEVNELEAGLHQFRLAYAAPRPGKQSMHTTRAVTATVEMSDAYRLSAYPNPIRKRATVELAVKERQEVTVQVYDVLGRAVTTLHEGSMRAQDTKRLSLDASELGLSSGTYFVRVKGEAFVATKRLTVVR